jgi:copper transport protein
MRALGFLILLALTALWSAPAASHATLIESRPADGAVLEQAPAQMELRFNEPVAPLVLKLVSVDGTSVTLDRHRRDGSTLVIEMPPIGRGTYALSWRVVSEDGHPVGGTILLSIGEAGPAAIPQAAGPVVRGLHAAIWCTKVALLAGLFLGVGGLCFGRFVAPLPPAARRICVVLLIVALFALPLSLGLQGLDALDLGFADFFDPAVWRTAVVTSYAITALMAAVAIASALVGLFAPSPALARALSLVALTGVGLALAASGHASAASPQWLMRPAVFLHAVCIGLWVGSLSPLGLILRAGRADGAAALSRFSQVIPYVLVPLAAAGIVLAAVQLGRMSALWTTAYGVLLLAKLVLVLALLGLAALNRWWLTARVQAGDAVAGRRLVRSIAVEVALAGAILAIAAGWRFTPPPRSLDAAVPAPAFVHIHGGKAMANMIVTPARVGPVAVEIEVATGDFAPLAAREVTLLLSNPAAGIEAIRRPAVPAGEATWHVDDLVIPAPGAWSVRINVLISDFEQVTLESVLEIAP